MAELVCDLEGGPAGNLIVVQTQFLRTRICWYHNKQLKGPRFCEIEGYHSGVSVD